MAVLAIATGNKFTRQNYDALRPIVNWETNPPDGLILHSCAFDNNGSLQVADIWETPQALEAFFKTRLLPALQQLGIEPPKMEFFPLHNVNAFAGIMQFTDQQLAGGTGD